MATLEIIGETKVLDISDKEYFDSKDYASMISNSRLSLLDPSIGGSSKAFLKGFDTNSYNPYFVIGSAVHKLKLQPESFSLSECCLPDGKEGMIALYISDKGIINPSENDYKEAIQNIGYYGNNITPNKLDKLKSSCEPFFSSISKEKKADKEMVYLTKDMKDTALKCLNALTLDKEIDYHMNKEIDSEFGEESKNEATLAVQVRITVKGKSIVVWLKGKIDRFRYDDDGNVCVIDLKTTFHNASGFSESFEKYKYYRQAAFYKILLESAGYTVKDFKFVVVSTTDFSTRIYRTKKSELEKGYDEIVSLLELAALTIMDYRYERDFIERYSIRNIAVPFSNKIKLISLLCAFYKKFKEKDKNYSERDVIEKIRKDKMANTSNQMVDKLVIWMKEFYSKDDSYPLFGMNTKEAVEFINDTLDKELPFSDFNYDDDLPF